MKSSVETRGGGVSDESSPVCRHIYYGTLVMEKYSRWRDAGTGIQPFLRPVPPRIDRGFITSIWKPMKDFVLGPILATARLVMLAAGLLLLSLVHFGSFMIPFSSPRRAIRRILISAIARAMLCLMGFYWISTEEISQRRTRGQPVSHVTVPASSIRSGDVIVANSQSYVDLLYMAFRFDPVFSMVYAADGSVKEINLLRALFSCGLRPPERSKTEKTESLNALVKRATMEGRGPVLMFPEATTSNGRALLRFAPVFRQFRFDQREKGTKIHICVLHYDYEDFPPPYTAGNRAWHLFRLCSQFTNSLSIRYLSTVESICGLPPPPPSSSLVTPAGDSDSDPLGQHIIGLMGQLGRLRKTGLDANDKREFMEFFDRQNAGKPATYRDEFWCMLHEIMSSQLNPSPNSDSSITGRQLDSITEAQEICSRQPGNYNETMQAYMDLTLVQNWKNVTVLESQGLRACFIRGEKSSGKLIAFPVGSLEHISISRLSDVFCEIEKVVTNVESLILAIVAPDSTVVYYVVHKGICAPSAG